MNEARAFDAVAAISRELSLPARGVGAVVQLLEEGNTVPFIARYRKERTGGLDEVQIRTIEERHGYLNELEERRSSILASLEEQGVLTPELRQRVLTAPSKSELEDLYLPYRPKRRTRATIARERGLEPLAHRILELPQRGNPTTEALPFVSEEKGVPDTDAALAGARDIVAEQVAEHADVRADVRDAFRRESIVTARVVKKKQGEAGKFKEYFDYREPVRRIPSHRYLAVCRGEAEGLLKVSLDLEIDRVLGQIRRHMRHRPHTPFSGELLTAIQDGCQRILFPSVSTEIRGELKEAADESAVDVFARNMRDLLLAPPLGEHAVIGIDPGLRTGCKCVSLDATGKLLEHGVIFPKQRNARDQLLDLMTKARPRAIAVGNGTGGRETEAFVRDVIRAEKLPDVTVVSVNEAGASVYSASDVAREEYPDLDLTVRGAISIGRRLQDPLSELVKIEPRSIGVGQYQHDVHQPLLKRRLDQVVESCVNAVGVELNTASAALLAYVAGIGPKVARSIVAHREKKGAFSTRQELLKVAGLGPKTFQQAAGFLRVRGGKNPLDSSAVHPERYKLVERMARDLSVGLSDLVGNSSLTDRLDSSRYTDDEVGELTLTDILDELRKPGRDPRDTFDPPKFRDDVHDLEDLTVGMTLEGVVTNVTHFGAFVDVGVHQDGLVHISELADHFVDDPHQEVHVGQKLRVTVLEIDAPRRRIALSSRRCQSPSGQAARERAPKNRQ